jgi:flagellar biosynthesis chaperone FliJ
MVGRIVVLVAGMAGIAVGAELPVREVVLYKNGIGYFQRVGELRPGESARLDFKASEMNDVLKSLTIMEEGGGRVTGLRYDSSEPVAKKLAELPFRLGERQPVTALLDQLKGARLEVRLGSQAQSGRIVGARQIPGDEKRPEREEVTLLLDSGELRSVDLSGATGLRLADPELELQLKDYLSVVAQERSREKRSLYIDSTDAKSRRMAVSYVIPAPVWKSSYRLIWRVGGEPLLEGWGIVDNTTGEDWKNVQLALVSGRPVSFISRLYEPRYVARPTAELPEEQAAAPVLYGGAVDELRERRTDKPAGMMGGVLAAAPRPLARAAAPAMERMEVASSVAPEAQARELGELFEYRFATPVTVRKDESAMLPFVQEKLSARKLLIYSEMGSVNARNAAEITNSTGKTLDGGPITVYEGNAYAGEALMETLKAGDKRLISYAVDLGARVTTQLGSSRDLIREVHVRRGLLTTRSALQETKTYTIRNVDPKAKILVIEHPVRPEYKLVNQKPAETTASAYRFEVRLAPAATEKFPVIEERVYESSIALANLTPDVLISYVQNKALSEAARKQLERIVELKKQLADTGQALRRTEEQINESSRDQDRIRQNMRSLNEVSGQQAQVQNYARQLAAQETQLAAQRDRLAELRKKKAALESELNAAIEKMEF